MLVHSVRRTSAGGGQGIGRFSHCLRSGNKNAFLFAFSAAEFVWNIHAVNDIAVNLDSSDVTTQETFLLWQQQPIKTFKIQEQE